MAVMWNGSLIPWIDPNGDPYAGAKVYFFNAGTTTPQATFTDSALSIPNDHPVIANGSGMFPAIFQSGGTYRMRIEDSSGVTIWDVDGISTPITEAAEVPEGDTPVELLARTGDLKGRYATGSHSGWVRANGRTIGAASSGATERANSDCEALFNHLWGVDADLAVSGGRGVSSASDWAANKTIVLPDFRHVPIVGLGTMGNSNANRIANARVTGGDNDKLGATGGADSVTLTIAQLPSHDHGGATSSNGSHSHDYITASQRNANTAGSQASSWNGEGGATTSTVGNHQHTVFAQGSGEAHNNMPPFKFATIYIKL